MNQLSLISSGHPAPTLACGEHPQARMEKFGVTALSDTELIATFLQGSGTRPDLAVAMASRLIAQAGSVAGLTRWTPHDFQRFRGIGRSKGLQLGALLEIGRRMTQAADKSPVMNRPELIAEHFRSIVTGLDVENMKLTMGVYTDVAQLSVIQESAACPHLKSPHPRRREAAPLRLHL